MPPHSPEYQFWLERAIKERPVAETVSSAARRPRRKYNTLHEEVFREAGVIYPPQPTQSEVDLARRMRLTNREMEVLYYVDRVAPMDQVHHDEMYIDLSQGIGRCRMSLSDTIPCVTPGGRLWKSRQQAWSLAPEAMLAQGLDPHYVADLTTYTNREILDLMGNAFNASSFLMSMITAFGCVDMCAP